MTLRQILGPLLAVAGSILLAWLFPRYAQCPACGERKLRAVGRHRLVRSRYNARCDACGHEVAEIATVETSWSVLWAFVAVAVVLAVAVVIWSRYR